MMTETEKMGARAKAAERILRVADPEEKTRALNLIADALVREQDRILAANAEDMAAAKENGMSVSMQDRLLLTPERIAGMADGVRAVAAWPDPVGKTLEEYDRPNGLHVKRVSVPLGVIGIIFEARPNVTSDCAALCLRAGNTVLLRGGKEAFRSNKAITQVMREALAETKIPEDSVQLVQDLTHESANEMMRMKQYLDVLIPRGGAGLIQAVVKNSDVPVIETGAGNCHIYIDRDADLDMAASIVVNAKTSRPSVCNAAEKLLIHRAAAAEALPAIAEKLREKQVELKGDEASRALLPDLEEAQEEDWAREYDDLVMSVKIVDSVEEAIDHIEKYSTHHSDCIITRDERAAQKFLTGIDSAAVYWNASTRFTDGGELGLGAEIGISTQRLHARGPMGVDQLTTYKFIITGEGQIRI